MNKKETEKEISDCTDDELRLWLISEFTREDGAIAGWFVRAIIAEMEARKMILK